MVLLKGMKRFNSTLFFLLFFHHKFITHIANHLNVFFALVYNYWKFIFFSVLGSKALVRLIWPSVSYDSNLFLPQILVYISTINHFTMQIRAF